jgi:GMP synthase-like glutamine amidotransferase
MMRIHYLQHVPFEDLANIGNWAKNKGHSVSVTKLWLNESHPGLECFDWLIVMGGPMNIYEEKKYPWLVKEKQFINEAIKEGKAVLGICLGAQLIADVLGGKVRKNDYKEIGWFPVSKTVEANNSVFFKSLPDEFMAFHWHGDTFDLPPGAIRLVKSLACENQAFEYNGKVLGLQFHLESSITSITRLIENCRDELIEGKYIQSENEILLNQDYLKEIKPNMDKLLSQIESIVGGAIV